MSENRSEGLVAGRQRNARCISLLLAMLTFVIGSVAFLIDTIIRERPIDSYDYNRHLAVPRGSLQEEIKRTGGVNRLKQIGLSFHHHDDRRGSLPAATTFDVNGRALHSWQTMLLPFIEQDYMFKMIDLGKPWNHPVNQETFRRHLYVYLHPVAPSRHDANGYAITNYAGNVHTLAGDKPRKLSDFQNGTSNVLLTGEVAGNFKPWGYPLNVRDPKLGLNRTPDGFGGPWTKGTHFLMADGSVRVFRNDGDPEFLKLLSGAERE